MVKPPVSVICFIVLFIFSHCNTKSKSNLEGSWQLEKLEINQTIFERKTLGVWKWEFNNRGIYVADAAGTKEEGTYMLKGDKLVLKPVIPPDRPEKTLTITQLDSIQLKLVSADTKNKSELYFLKIQ